MKRYALPYVLRVRDPGLHHLLLFVIKHSEDFWQFRSYNSEEIQRGHHVHWCVRSRGARPYDPVRNGDRRESEVISRPRAPTSKAIAAASSHRPWQTVEVSIAVTTKLHCDLAFNWVTILPHIYFDGRQRL